jgi:hypothetical protein
VFFGVVHKFLGTCVQTIKFVGVVVFEKKRFQEKVDPCHIRTEEEISLSLKKEYGLPRG